MGLGKSRDEEATRLRDTENRKAVCKMGHVKLESSRSIIRLLLSFLREFVSFPANIEIAVVNNI